MIEEAGLFAEVDQEQLERTIKQIQEQRFFHREFAKDLKRLEQPSRPHRRKNDMIDSFIDGEVELEEVLSRMQEERKHSRGVNRATANNKRISEMFAREKPKTKQVNKSAFVTLQDFLNDMEDDDSVPPSS